MTVYVVTAYDAESAVPSVHSTLEGAKESMDKWIADYLEEGFTIAEDVTDLVPDLSPKVLRLVQFTSSEEDVCDPSVVLTENEVL